jgi:hypothetical protein
MLPSGVEAGLTGTRLNTMDNADWPTAQADLVELEHVIEALGTVDFV